MIPIHEKAVEDAALQWVGGKDGLESIGRDPAQQGRSDQHPHDQFADMKGDLQSSGDLAADPGREEQHRDVQHQEQQLVVVHRCPARAAATHGFCPRSRDSTPTPRQLSAHAKRHDRPVAYGLLWPVVGAVRPIEKPPRFRPSENVSLGLLFL